MGGDLDEDMPASMCVDDSQAEDLKRFSIYNLYQECNLRGQGLAFNSAASLQVN